MRPILRFLVIIPLIISVLLPQVLDAEEIVNEVFLMERHDKLLAFSGLRNNWFEKKLRTSENLVESKYDGNVAVAHTNERALAFSAITGRWTEERFRIGEAVVSISAEGNISTIITNIRALGFSAKTGVWVESQFNIGE